MRPHGRAFVSTTNPDAFAVCDRCGFLYNRRSGLRFQWDYRGGQMVNTRLLVCWTCHDKPFMLNKPIYIPPDPEPIMDARPENMVDPSLTTGTAFLTESGDELTTEDDLILVSE